jgi:hypothetical protein
VLFAKATAKAVLFDAGELAETPHALERLVIAASAVVGGFLRQRLEVARTSGRGVGGARRRERRARRPRSSSTTSQR